MASHVSISRLARNIRRPDVPVWVPRSQHPVFHVGMLDDVDNGRNLASFAWNDPSGAITAGVPIAMSYTPDHLPASGHVVQAMQWGNTLQIMNRIIVPSGFITIP